MFTTLSYRINNNKSNDRNLNRPLLFHFSSHLKVHQNSLLFIIKLSIIFTVADVAQSVEQLIRNQQVAGSIPATSFILIFKFALTHYFYYAIIFSRYLCGYSLVVEHQLPKLNMRVRFPLPAPEKIRRKPFRFAPLLFTDNTI